MSLLADLSDKGIDFLLSDTPKTMFTKHCADDVPIMRNGIFVSAINYGAHPQSVNGFNFTLPMTYLPLNNNSKMQEMLISPRCRSGEQ